MASYWSKAGRLVPWVVGLLVVLAMFAVTAGQGPVAQPFPPAPGPPPAILKPRCILLRTPDLVGTLSFEVSVAFSSDGRMVAVGRMEGSPQAMGTVVSLCDVATQKERLTIKGRNSNTCAVAFSPDGQSLAVGRDEAITFYEPEAGRKLSKLDLQNDGGPVGLGFSDDGKKLAAATISGNLVVWNLATKRKVLGLGVHTRSAQGVAISPDGKWVAAASDGPIVCHPVQGLFGSGVECGPDYGITRLFDVSTGKEQANIKHDWTAHSAAFAPDGHLLASGGGGSVKLLYLDLKKERTIFKADPGFDVYCVTFAPDGCTLAIGLGSRDFKGSEGEVRLWDLKEERIWAVLKGETGKVRSLAFSPDGEKLVSGSRETVVLWDLPLDDLQPPHPKVRKPVQMP